MKRYTTTSYEQTQKLGERLAKEILKSPSKKRAIVLGLQGNLGAGKTTFLQGFAKGLGIKEKILSPTFVILKRFVINKALKNQSTNFKKISARPSTQRIECSGFYHIDCYRLKNEKDMLALNFKEIIYNPENIVAIEWPEKIKKVLPKDTILIKFKFIDKNKREIKFKI